MHDVDVATDKLVEQSQLIALRRSRRKRKYTITDDYVVYIKELDYDIEIKRDPFLFSQAIKNNDYEK